MTELSESKSREKCGKWLLFISNPHSSSFLEKGKNSVGRRSDLPDKKTTESSRGIIPVIKFCPMRRSVKARILTSGNYERLENSFG